MLQKNLDDQISLVNILPQLEEHLNKPVYILHQMKEYLTRSVYILPQLEEYLIRSVYGDCLLAGSQKNFLLGTTWNAILKIRHY
jgi:hypothetical protein